MKQKAFTIVELLIVIVVIGILAAITVVAYTGMQTRAKNTQVATAATSYNKAIQSYIIDNGTNPSVTGCLGANYPGNQCWSGTNGNVTVSASLDSQLAKYIPSKPTVATALMAMDANNNRAGLAYLLNVPTSGWGELRYYLTGLNQSCVADFIATNEGNLTNCYRRFAP
jgi:prepilin-type N-terminal cleavage/methylation domain-containing protein